jgi:hypothetical protein
LGAFVFQLCPSNNKFYRRIQSHTTSTEYKHLIGNTIADMKVKKQIYKDIPFPVILFALTYFQQFLTLSLPLKMKYWFIIFRSTLICLKEIKSVNSCVVYVMMLSKSYLGRFNVRLTGESELSTERTISWIRFKCHF